MRTLRNISGFRRGALLIFAALIVMALVPGCNSAKNLTPSTARDLIQEKIRAEGQENIRVNYAPTARLADTKVFADYRDNRFTGSNAAAAMHRLLNAGFVEQSSGRTVYPNLAGTYTGDGQWDISSVTLITKPGSPMVTGSYKYDYCNGPLKGILNGDMTIEIAPLSGGGWGPCSHDRPPRVYAIQQTGDDINLICRTTAVCGGNFHGKATGAPIELTTYTYSFTPKMREFDGGAAHTANIGRFYVDDVTNLLLEAEVSAGGRYAWHAEYNAFGQALMGAVRIEGNGKAGFPPLGNARFQKQPDGVWVCTSH